MASFIRWVGISIVVGSFCVLLQTTSKAANTDIEIAEKGKTMIFNNLVFLAGISLFLVSHLEENNIYKHKK